MILLFMKPILYTTILFAIAISFSACNSGTQTEISKNKIIDDNVILDSTVIYLKILKTDSLNDPIRINLAANYYFNKEYDKAIFHFLKVYYHDNKNLKSLVALGNLYYDSQQYENAIKFYQKSLAIDSSNVGVRCDMATCYLNNDKPETAMKLLKENIKMNYNHAQSHHNLSVVYDKLKMTKESEKELTIFNQLTAK